VGHSQGGQAALFTGLIAQDYAPYLTLFGVVAAAPRYRAVAVSSTSSPRAIRGRCYCVRNLYATIRATMLAKISRAVMDFRIGGIVEWRAADRPG
jgi:hypothetical protein